MKNFDHILKEALNKTHTIVEQFLSYSRENANRRTLIIVPVVVICLLIPYLLFVRPPSVFPSGELVEIPEGLSLSEIAELLEREQVVRSAVLFRSAVYVFGRERNVKFGDYFFKEPRNVLSSRVHFHMESTGWNPYAYVFPRALWCAKWFHCSLRT